MGGVAFGSGGACEGFSRSGDMFEIRVRESRTLERTVDLAIHRIVERHVAKTEHLRGFDDGHADGVARFIHQHGAAELEKLQEIVTSGHGFFRATPGGGGELADGDRGGEEGGQSDPVLRVGDGERSNRRQEEIVEAEHGGHGRYDGFGEPELRGSSQHHEQHEQSFGGSVEGEQVAAGENQRREAREADGVARKRGGESSGRAGHLASSLMISGLTIKKKSVYCIRIIITSTDRVRGEYSVGRWPPPACS